MRFRGGRVIDHSALQTLRQLVAELALISHAPTSNYGNRQPVDSGEDIGGKRPPGSDREMPNRRDMDEMTAFLASYHRRTPEYFRQELDRCSTVERLEELVVEAREALDAWRRAPIPPGQEPEYGSPQWKRFIAESSEDAGTLASRYWNPTTGRQITRQYIHKVRRDYQG